MFRSRYAYHSNSYSTVRFFYRIGLKSRCVVGLLFVFTFSGGLAGEGLESVPHKPRSKPEGETLFTELTPESTGIVTTNRYDDPRMWGRRHSELSVGAIGTGVAVGDYDGDGWPDVFIVSKIESSRLFRNLGNWRFEDVTEAAGLWDESGEWKQGASFVDVNNDGLLDLYQCRFDASNQLYINQGDGTFLDEAASRGLAVFDASSMGCFADYDRDGWLDVYIQTNIKDAAVNVEGQPDYLFRNRGDGTFEEVTEKAGILPTRTQGHSATWWDFNEDGWLDLYVANDFAPPDFLYRNNGDGTFTNVIDEEIPHTPVSSMGADFGDIDNDGHIDFFVADMAGTTYEFTQRGLSDSRSRVDEAHVDRPDEAVQLNYNALYLNTGFGRVREVAHLVGLEGTDWTWSPRFEDYNNDGLLDLFVTNGMDREHNNLDFIVRKLTAVNYMGRIRITKKSPVLNQANLAYENRGDLRYEAVGPKWGLDKVGVSFGSATGDFDLDGDLDIIVSNYQEPASIYRNDSQDGNRITIELRGDDSNHFGIGARLEASTKSGIQVRQLISARGYLSTSESLLHFGLGGDEQVDQLKIVWPNGAVQRLESLKSGYRYVISEVGSERAVSVEPEKERVYVFEEVASELGLEILQQEQQLEGTLRQPLLPKRLNRRGPGIAVGDLDDDLDDEVVFAGTSVDGPKVLNWNDGMYREKEYKDLEEVQPVNDGPPLVFDADGDGVDDLLFTGGGAAFPGEEPEYEPRLWLGKGDGAFSRAAKDAVSSAPISVGAAVSADFNRDGFLDLFLGGRVYPGFYPEPADSVLFLQEEGRQVDRTRAFAPGLSEIGLVTSALASDVDDDGWMDLVVSLEWGGVRFFRNEEGNRMRDVSGKWGFDAAGTGLWSSLEADDFNGDGKLDYVLGNQGLNTFYKASKEFPMKLLVSDFAGDGDPQLILAFYERGRLLPVASRAEIGAKIPQVLQRFPSNDEFAAADMQGIFGEPALSEATVYEASELRSGVLLSQPNGVFTFNPLPRYAQISPVQGLVCEDFDGDGNSDILLVNNDFTAIPSQGRFDSGVGWLLKGDGNGNFDCVPADKSGWVVTGNSKALAILDWNRDAKPDAVVSRNNQNSLAFSNTVESGGRYFAVRLKGEGGNQRAVGARVRLLENGKLIDVEEARAGGGYSSQSTSTLFFAVPEGVDDGLILEVRWPSGKVKTYPVTKGGYMTISR